MGFSLDRVLIHGRGSFARQVMPAMVMMAPVLHVVQQRFGLFG